MPITMLQTSRGWRHMPLIGMPLLLSWALVGCGSGRNTELADQRIAMRTEHTARAAKFVGENELSRRPTATLNTVRRGERLHAKLSDENIVEMKGYWHRDWQRWNDRQPDYRRKAGQILWGEPESVEPDGITLFF